MLYWACHAAPATAIITNNLSLISHSKYIACRTAPYAVDSLWNAAGHGAPGSSIVMKNRSIITGCEYIIACGTPDYPQLIACWRQGVNSSQPACAGSVNSKINKNRNRFIDGYFIKYFMVDSFHSRALIIKKASPVKNGTGSLGNVQFSFPNTGGSTFSSTTLLTTLHGI